MMGCVEMLRTCNGSTMIPRAHLREGAPSLHSDASTWGFGWICDQTRRFASEPWPLEVADVHINVLEMAAASAGMLDLQQQLAAKNAAPAAVHVYCDNTSACACISTLGTSALSLAPCTNTLANAAASLNFTPLVSWVQSELNPADAPSRGLVPPALAGWTRARYSQAQMALWAVPPAGASGTACLLSSMTERRCPSTYDSPSAASAC